nr:glycosyltransferase [Comamonas jiangduensis]
MFISNQKDYESFNVCWWGTYIPLHGLENLIRAFSHIGNDRIKLYLFGDSNEKAKPYVSLIKSLELTDRVFINNDFHFSNGKLAPILAGTCDLAVGNFGSSDKAKTVLVNKLVDALSFGIPCLTIKTSATTELLPNNEGLIITESNPESIAFKIEECFNKRSTLNEIGMSGKKKYFDLFSPDIFRIKLLAILQE